MKAEIIRLEESEQGTLGIFRIDGVIFCSTLEPPYLENRKNVSCIPPRVYYCKKITSPKYGKTYEVTNIPNRSHVLFHAGNVLQDTRGCILLGQHFGKFRGNRAILNSGKTFEAFMETITADVFTLKIWAYFDPNTWRD